LFDEPLSRSPYFLTEPLLTPYVTDPVRDILSWGDGEASAGLISRLRLDVARGNVSRFEGSRETGDEFISSPSVLFDVLRT